MIDSKTIRLLRPILINPARLVYWVLLLLAVATLFGLYWFSQSKVVINTVDLSWPNCNRLTNVRYSQAIIGVNGGLDYRPNLCSASEASLVENYAVYVNSGNPGFPRIGLLGLGPLNCPDFKNLDCSSFNYGYQAAEYSIQQANMAGLHSPMWWIDVESINSWTLSEEANRADIMGMIYAVRAIPLLTPIVGIYTAANQWYSEVGHWQNGLPLWLGTGSLTRVGAIEACHQVSVTGGPISLTQYTIDQLDYNYHCQARVGSKYLNG